MRRANVQRVRRGKMPAFRQSVKRAMVRRRETYTMPDISFIIAQRTYTLRCAAGQEARLEAAAAELGERVDKLAARAGAGGDRQLLVIAALELLDALKGAEERAVNQAKGETEEARAEAAALRAWAGSMAARLDALAADGDPLVPPAKDA